MEQIVSTWKRIRLLISNLLNPLGSCIFLNKKKLNERITIVTNNAVLEINCHLITLRVDSWFRRKNRLIPVYMVSTTCPDNADDFIKHCCDLVVFYPQRRLSKTSSSDIFAIISSHYVLTLQEYLAGKRN